MEVGVDMDIWVTVRLETAFSCPALSLAFSTVDFRCPTLLFATYSQATQKAPSFRKVADTSISTSIDPCILMSRFE